MSVKRRILIPMIAAAVLAASLILVSSIYQFSRYVDSSVDEELDRAILKINSELELLGSTAATASLFFSVDPAVVNALENKDRPALLARAENIRNDYGIETSVFTDTAGIVLARAHRPEAYGDDLTNMYCIRSAIMGEPQITTEGGAKVDMLVCAAAPVYTEDGLFVGVVAVGYRLDTLEFVDRQKEITGIEVSVFRFDQRVATTLKDEDDNRAVGMRASDHISDIVLGGGTFTGQTKVQGRDILTKYVPIIDSENNAIGMLVVGRYLTEKTSMVGSFVTIGLIVTVVLLGVIITLTLFISERVSAPIAKRLDLVHYDELTGIYNRRYYEENITRVIKSQSRGGGVLSLLMVDIDWFKAYNDAYGHRAGDKCLRIIAEALSEAVMRADDFVARYGGEEFVVVLPSTDEDGARTVANRLLENTRNCNVRHEKSETASWVTISVGITTGYPKHTQTGGDYVKRADEMLYKSKQNGRNQYSFSVMDDSPPVSLASAQQALASLKRKKNLTDILNEIAFLFLSRSDGMFEDTLSAGIDLVVESVQIDTVSIWRNIRKYDGMHMSQIYRWDKEAGGTTSAIAELSNIAYAKYAPGWEALFTAGKSVNSPIKQLPDREAADALSKFGIVSVFSTPIMSNDELWGFVLFGDRCSERYFDDESAEVMQSAAFLFANATIREQLERELIEMEKQLEHALYEAKEANRSKDEFLSRMSHEMLTPMNAIMGMTQILKMQLLEDTQAEHLYEIDAASRHLLKLIKDLLDVSAKNDDASAVKDTPFSFDLIIDEVLKTITPLYSEKKQTFLYEPDRSIPTPLIGDKKRLAQIITHLLENAVKFTPNFGKIKLASSLLSDEDNKVTLQISVSDNGIGIAKELQDNIFIVFGQVDESLSAKHEGAGLGLHIAKRDVELLGGKISVDSELGKGAEFTFTCQFKKG